MKARFGGSRQPSYLYTAANSRKVSQIATTQVISRQISIVELNENGAFAEYESRVTNDLHPVINSTRTTDVPAFIMMNEPARNLIDSELEIDLPQDMTTS